MKHEDIEMPTSKATSLFLISRSFNTIYSTFCTAASRVCFSFNIFPPFLEFILLQNFFLLRIPYANLHISIGLEHLIPFAHKIWYKYKKIASKVSVIVTANVLFSASVTMEDEGTRVSS